MSSTKEQVSIFLEKCEELRKCKFIMATTKIKDLLKCIVNSPDLYKLFETVTKEFNYTEQKAKCLVTTNDGMLNRCYLALPQTIGQRLAFIFCLMVEFDRDTLNFNDFLQVYFQEDGSYFASYQAFCNTVILSLEDMIKQVFKHQLEEEQTETEEVHQSAAVTNPVRSNLVSAIWLAIEAEKQYILRSSIPKDEQEGGLKMLNALDNAVRSGNEDIIDALICGYNYFVLYHKSVSDGIAPLIEMIAEFEDNI